MAEAMQPVHIESRAAAKDAMQIDEIIENFEFLDDWDDRYRYLIELGRTLEPLPEEAHNAANKVQGCASQVWLETKVSRDPGRGPVLHFRGDSDAHIVRGLVALTLGLYSDRPAKEIIDTDAAAVFERLGFSQHLTPQRSNGLRSMVERIKSEARAAEAHHLAKRPAH
ncbi:MAG: SufE family protein [Beijerinckiaceae bacterium]